MIKLTSFQQSDFDTLISWIDSKELLLTIAGTVFTYPLTHDQLQKYLNDDKSHSFNIIDENDTIIGHAEILFSDDGKCKIDKLIIGNRSERGKGTGQLVINKLLEYAFRIPAIQEVELNVFDWNIAGIKCYEKCGFKMNPAKTQEFKINNETWMALNMTIDRYQWEDKK